MKFTIDGQDTFTLLDWQKSLIKNDIPSSIFDDDMRRRAIYCVESPIQKSIHLKKDVLCKELKELGVTDIPGTIEELTIFIGSRTDMGFAQSEMPEGCQLECDSVSFHTVSCSSLTLAKSFFKLSELKYITQQISWVLNEKIKGCLRRMHSEWDPKLASKGIKVPLDDETFVNLVLSQPNYKDRLTRDQENESM